MGRAVRGARRWLRTLRFAAGLTLGSGACASDTPCLKWIDVGKVYEVEILRWYDPTQPRTDSLIRPYGQFSTGVGCKDTLDDRGFFVDHTLMIEAARLVGEPKGCRDVEADTKLPVTVLDDDRPPQPGIEGFGKTTRVRISNGCEGEYWLGLVRVDEPYQQAYPRSAISDYMLVREFIPRTYVQQCTGTRSCADSWFVRIRGPAGELISKDLAEPRDAGP